MPRFDPTEVGRLLVRLTPQEVRKVAGMVVEAPEPDGILAGIIEADEARQRESSKGSRERVRHRRDPATHPAPRLRWRAYRRRGGSATAPPGGWRAWEKTLLAATDRAGHRAVEVIADAGRTAISGALCR